MKTILAVDVGNSEIDFGLFDGRAVRLHFSKGTNTSESPDEIGLFLLEMFERKRIGTSKIKGAAMCSVVPEMTATVQRTIETLLSVKPFVLSADAELPIGFLIDNPREVGTDRLANAVAAYKNHGGPAIVIDCGTATTLSVVTSKGEFAGGAILPGLKTMIGALSLRTAKLPDIPLGKPERFIGRNTVEAIRAGVIHGFCGAITHLVSGITAELGSSRPKIITTGGLAPFLGSIIPWIDSMEPSLTLEGIGLIFFHNELSNERSDG